MNNVDVHLGELRSVETNSSNEFIQKLIGTPNKKFIMKVDMEFINSTEFHQPDLYPYNLVDQVNGDYVFHTPTLNGINFMMPTSPLLYHNNEMNQVQTFQLKFF